MHFGYLKQSHIIVTFSLFVMGNQHLKDTEITWEEAEELAVDKAGWHQRVAQDVG